MCVCVHLDLSMYVYVGIYHKVLSISLLSKLEKNLYKN